MEYCVGVQRLLVGWAMWCGAAFAVVGCSKPDGSGCGSDGECAVDSRCVYRIADGCAAVRTCQPNQTGAMCDLVTSYCGCDGAVIAVGCDVASGYARAPIMVPASNSCQTADGGGQD
jgi:hypothetical protein